MYTYIYMYVCIHTYIYILIWSNMAKSPVNLPKNLHIMAMALLQRSPAARHGTERWWNPSAPSTARLHHPAAWTLQGVAGKV